MLGDSTIIIILFFSCKKWKLLFSKDALTLIKTDAEIYDTRDSNI